MNRNSIRTSIAFFVITATFVCGFTVTPSASAEVIAGLLYTGETGAFIVTVYNASNSREPVTSVTIDEGDFSFTGTGALYVRGTGTGTLSHTGSGVKADFASSPLLPGSCAKVVISNVTFPGTAGGYALSLQAEGISGNTVSVASAYGGALYFTIASARAFKSLPYARVILMGGNNTYRSGNKVAGTYGAYNHYACIVYNPHASGSPITEVTLSIPPEYRTYGSTWMYVTNVTTGAEAATPVNVGAISADGVKDVTATLSTPIEEGEAGVVYVKTVSSPSGAGAYTWALSVKDEAGTEVAALPMRGYDDSLVQRHYGGVNGVYFDIYPSYSVDERVIGWPTKGYSNNVFRMTIHNYRRSWTIASHDPMKMSNVNFDFTSAGLYEPQTNYLGPSTNRAGISNGTYICVPMQVNSTTTSYAKSFFATLTNVVNPFTEGTYTFDAVYDDTEVAFGTTSGYTREVTIVSNLFTNENIPAQGIVTLDKTRTNEVGNYYYVFHNPTNAGDSIDVLRVSIPAGYTLSSFTPEDSRVLGGTAVIASSASTPTSFDIFFSSTAPLGEGATIFIPIALTNPSSSGSQTLTGSATFSGLRDLDELFAQGTMPQALVTAYGIASEIETVSAGVVVDTNDYISTREVRTNSSADGRCSVIIASNTFSEAALLTVSNRSPFELASYPPFLIENYRIVSNASATFVYDIAYSHAPMKALTLTFDYASFTSVITNAERLSFVYYAEDEGEWQLFNAAVDTNAETLSRTTYLSGLWRVAERMVDLTSGSSVVTNTSSDGLFRVISTNGTFDGNAVVTISNINSIYLSAVPALNVEGYREVRTATYSLVYDVSYTLPALIPVSLSVSYSNHYSAMSVADRLALARYDVSEGTWRIASSTVDTNAETVSARSLDTGIWMLVERTYAETPTDGIFTNTSSDGMVSIISSNGAFISPAQVSIDEVSGIYRANIPELDLEGYRILENTSYSMTYDIAYSEQPALPLTVVFSYTNVDTTIQNAANLKLLYFDASLSNWVAYPSVVDTTNGTVRAYSMQAGRWRLGEQELNSNEVSVSPLYGGTYYSADSNLSFHVLAEGFAKESIVAIEKAEIVNLPSDLRALSDAYTITSTRALTKGATVTFFFTTNDIVGRPVDTLALAYYDGYNQSWHTVATEVDVVGLNARASTLHFATWLLVEDRVPQTNSIVSGLYTYPNPSTTGETTISFSIREIAKVSVRVYDRYGRVVVDLTKGRDYEAGLVDLAWNGRTQGGEDVPNGVYLVKIAVWTSGLNATRYEELRKVVISR